MARVVLPFVKYKRVAQLPPVCIRCGKPATRTIQMQFKGRVTRVLGIRLYALGGGEDYVIVDVPLCDGHPFMGQAVLIMLLGFVLLLPFIALGAITKPWVHHYLVAFPLIAMIVVGSLFVFYVFLSSIDGQGFDDDGVTATGVSPAFVAALNDEDWTHDAFVARLRKNRKGRVKPYRPFWLTYYFVVPVGIVLSFACCTPIGFLTASREPAEAGGWPAGLWAGRPPGPDGAPANQPPPAPVVVVPEPFNPKSLGGLVGYWPLDEGKGGAAHDQSGNGIMAIRHGGEWVDGVRGKALRLDGQRDFLDLGPADNRLSFAAGAPFTVAGWVSTIADEGVIASFRRQGKGFPVVDLLVKDGKVRGWVRDDTSGKGGAIPIGGAIADGKWHHVALVRQPDGTVELYLDGTLQAKDRGASSGGPITTDLHTLGSDRFIVQAKQKRAAYFAGSIDEFCVFDRALPADDIAVLMGGKKG